MQPYIVRLTASITLADLRRWIQDHSGTAEAPRCRGLGVLWRRLFAAVAWRSRWRSALSFDPRGLPRQPRYVEKIGFGALGGSLSLVPQRAAIMPAISARVWPTCCCSRM